MSRKPITPWSTVDSNEAVRCSVCGWAGTLEACFHRYFPTPDWDEGNLLGVDRWEFQCHLCTTLVSVKPAPPLEYLTKYGAGTVAHWYDVSIYEPGHAGRYLVYMYYNDSVAICFWNGSKWLDAGAAVTFWAPLPDRPANHATGYVKAGHGRVVDGVDHE